MVDTTILLISAAVFLGDQLLESLFNSSLCKVEIAEERICFDALV